MINIELQDALFIYILFYSLGLFLMLFLSFYYRGRVKGIGYFNNYFILNVIGITGIYFRDNLSTWISIILANLILFVATLFLLSAILRFLNKKIPYLFFTIYSLVFVLLFIYFTEVNFNVSVRIALFGLSIMLIYIIILYILHEENKKNSLNIDFFSLVILLHLTIQIFRIIGLISSANPSSFFEYKSDSINVILLGATGSFNVAGILSLINNKFLNAIDEGENALNKLIENVPTPAMIHNNHGKMLKISKSFTELSGYSLEDIPDVETWTNKAYSGDKVKEVQDLIKKFYSEKNIKHNTEVLINTKDGSKRNWDFHSGYLGNNSKGEEMALSIALDTTESSELRSSLTISKNRLNLAQSIAKVGSWELDLSTNKIWASKVAFEIYEITQESEFIDLDKIQAMRDKDGNDEAGQALINLLENNIPYEVSFKINTPTGKIKFIHSRAIIIKDEKGKPSKVLGVFQDVTSLKEKELELEYSAFNDYLTGLNNRRYYEEKLKLIDIQSNYPLTIVMADINGLKLINDAFGHESGDNLLVSAAKILKEGARKTDIVARIGGDEFVIVMPKTSEKEAEKIIDKINEKSKDIYIQSIELSISFGYKTKHKDSENIQDIYRSAEDLMYREKLLEIPSMRSGAIEAILSTLYEKDKGSEVHSRSVSMYSERIAKLYGMDRQDVQEVKTAGILHDIGKIIIPIKILQKDGKLSTEEYETIKNHSEIGFRILNSTSDMRNISDIILNHHERWDGAGYPRGIKGENIPLKSRIISIADAFDAMTSARSYRETISIEDALQELIANSGTQFDPSLVKIFKENLINITT